MATKKKKRRPGLTQHDIDTEGLPSASGFDSEFRCPGKRALCAPLPKDDDTAATLRGQRIHKAMETWDLELLSETERRLAQRIMYGESELVHEYNFEGAEITFEERVWDFKDDLTHTWSGQVDRYDWQPETRRLLVIDDKTGWTTPPPIHDNWQLRSEGALLAERLDANETVVALIHPYHPDSLWEAAVYTRSETNDLLDIVRHNVTKIQMPDQPRIAGGIQCQWCPAKRICPEYIAKVEQLAQAIDDEIQDEGFTAIIRRSKAQRGDHVRWIKELEKGCEFMLNQYVELMIREGMNSIEGWTLRRQMRRTVSDESRAIELTEIAFGEDAKNAALQFSLTALEEILKKKWGAKKAKEEVMRVLRPVIHFEKTKYFLDESKSV